MNAGILDLKSSGFRTKFLQLMWEVNISSHTEIDEGIFNRFYFILKVKSDWK